MSLIKKSDVKNHLSPRHGTKIHLRAPERPSGPTGSAVAQPGAIEAKPSAFANDFIADHSSGIALAPTDSVTSSSGTLAPATSKSARA